MKAVIVGAGLIAGKKHVPAWRRLAGAVELAAICDVNVQQAERLARETGVPRAYGDVGEMLEREKPDVVDVCTPPKTHVTLAVQAMRHGSHVLIEKPMAMTVAECDRIVETARACRVKVCVAHTDLFYPPFMRACELVAAGAIGQFRGLRIHLSTPTDYMTSRQDHWAHRLPGGVIGETGPHVVYMTLAFINPVREVTVSAMKQLAYPWSRFDDYRIEMVGDAGASSVTLSYGTKHWAARVDVLGSERSLLLDLEGMTLVRYGRPTLRHLPIARSVLSEAGQLVGTLCTSALRVVTGRHRNTHEILLERFVDAIRRDGDPPVTADEGREAVRVLGMIVGRLDPAAS